MTHLGHASVMQQELLHPLLAALVNYHIFLSKIFGGACMLATMPYVASTT